MNYWENRWNEGKIGWHKDEVNKFLVKYINLEKHSNVCVPLCGKTIDLVWLSEHISGTVCGVELCTKAVVDFFVENKLDYEVEKFEDHEVYYETKKKKIKIYRGSILTTPISEKFELIYDRAALVAMNPTDRKDYSEKLKSLSKPSGQMLLIALLREENRQGPPHHTSHEDVKQLYQNAEIIETEDDSSSIERLGLIVQNIYLFGLLKQ